MNFRRASLSLALFGVLLIVLPPALNALGVWTWLVEAVRAGRGVSYEFFAVRGFINFMSGGLLNIVAFQAFGAAAVLFALGQDR